MRVSHPTLAPATEHPQLQPPVAYKPFQAPEQPSDTKFLKAPEFADADKEAETALKSFAAISATQAGSKEQVAAWKKVNESFFSADLLKRLAADPSSTRTLDLWSDMGLQDLSSAEPVLIAEGVEDTQFTRQCIDFYAEDPARWSGFLDRALEGKQNGHAERPNFMSLLGRELKTANWNEKYTPRLQELAQAVEKRVLPNGKTALLSPMQANSLASAVAQLKENDISVRPEVHEALASKGDSLTAILLGDMGKKEHLEKLAQYIRTLPPDHYIRFSDLGTEGMINEEKMKTIASSIFSKDVGLNLEDRKQLLRLPTQAVSGPDPLNGLDNRDFLAYQFADLVTKSIKDTKDGEVLKTYCDTIAAMGRVDAQEYYQSFLSVVASKSPDKQGWFSDDHNIHMKALKDLQAKTGWKAGEILTKFYDQGYLDTVTDGEAEAVKNMLKDTTSLEAQTAIQALFGNERLGVGKSEYMGVFLNEVEDFSSSDKKELFGALSNKLTTEQLYEFGIELAKVDEDSSEGEFADSAIKLWENQPEKALGLSSGLVNISNDDKSLYEVDRSDYEARLKTALKILEAGEGKSERTDGAIEKEIRRIHDWAKQVDIDLD